MMLSVWTFVDKSLMGSAPQVVPERRRNGDPAPKSPLRRFGPVVSRILIEPSALNPTVHEFATRPQR